METQLGVGAGPFVFAASPAAALFWPTVTQYAWLGVEHILLGFDHILFVLGLTLLVRGVRTLVWTLSAFTVAHSLTLSLSALGWFVAPSAAVELAIALSILLVAVEASNSSASLSKRYPWLVAFGFGLLHGFGFAGALVEIGLPEARILPALLAFNLGVELGQLALMSALVVGSFAARRMATDRALLRHFGLGRTVLVYLVGCMAAHLCFDRGVTFLFA
jgi:hypothetical protein